MSDLKKVNFNLSENLLKKIDDFALEMGLNRTAAITVLVNNALDHRYSSKNISGRSEKK